MAATRSIGTILTKTSGTPLTVADINKLGALGITSNEIDVTTLDSPSNYKEFIAGFKDAGEISLSGLIKTETSFQTLLTLAEAQSVETWTITFPSGAKLFFQGFVKQMEEAESTPENVRGFTGSIRTTGKVVYASSGVSS